MNTQVNTIGAILIGVISSGGLWTTLQFLLNRSGRKAEASRINAAEEKDREDARKAETERLAFIQEVERRAYDRAVSAAEEKVESVEEQCNRCLSEMAQLQRDRVRERREYEQRLSNLEQSNYALVDASLEIVPLLDADAEHTKTLRAAIRTARQSRYRFANDNDDEF